MPTADKSQTNAKPINYSKYESHAKSAQKFEEKMEQVKIRLPVGSRELVQAYVTAKAKEDPTNPRYSAWNGKAWLPSVNALVRALLEQEMGVDFSELASDKPKDV